LSYSPKFQLLKCILSQEISLQRSPEFAIDTCHFETNTQRPGRARPLSVTSCCPRHLSWQACLVLEDMVDIQPFRFKPERVPNPEDSGNEEVNDRSQGTFWCTCERCEIMPMRRECVCCRKQVESGSKMTGRIFCIYCVGRSNWKDNFSL